MEIDDERLEELANECDTSLAHVKRLYNLIKDIPCVFMKDDETFLRCLQTLISDRISQTFIQSQSRDYDKRKDLRYSISDALYRYYEDDAIPYLSETYIQMHELDGGYSL